MNQPATAHGAQSTKAALAFTNDALITAQGAADAGGVARRFRWQIKDGTRVGVDRVHLLTRSRELFAQAIATDSYGLGNERGGALAKQASPIS